MSLDKCRAICTPTAGGDGGDKTKWRWKVSDALRNHQILNVDINAGVAAKRAREAVCRGRESNVF